MNRKKSIVRHVFVVVAMLVFACQEEAIQINKGADCGGCEDPSPPILTDNPGRCGDLVIKDITWSIVDDQYLLIEVELKNVGSQPIYDDDYILQSYLSTDDQFSPFDAGAGGISREISLAPGASVIHNTQFYNPGLIKDYEFIIVTATLDAKSNDCNPGNNMGVKSIW